MKSWMKGTILKMKKKLYFADEYDEDEEHRYEDDGGSFSSDDQQYRDESSDAGQGDQKPNDVEDLGNFLKAGWDDSLFSIGDEPKKSNEDHTDSENKQNSKKKRKFQGKDPIKTKRQRKHIEYEEESNRDDQKEYEHM